MRLDDMEWRAGCPACGVRVALARMVDVGLDLELHDGEDGDGDWNGSWPADAMLVSVLRFLSRSSPLESRAGALANSRIFPALLRRLPPALPLPSTPPFSRSLSSRPDMSQNISVHFLGTTSGGGPTETRNCSSLVVDPFGGSGQLWMVDCAEGTVRQFEKQPYRPGQQRLRIGQVSKIFITHMHADHTMGLLTFLRNTLGIPKPPGTTPADAPPPNKHRPRIEIFGPRGTRRMLRMLWHITHSHSEFAYVVHELLFEGEQPSVAADVPPEREGADEADIRRESECVGRDIWCDEQGFWKGIVDMSAKQSHGLWGAVVDAGPIQHRDPCIGYIIREIPRYPLTVESPMPRKLVILGDTYDPSTIAPLIHADGPPSLSSSPEASTSSSPLPDDSPLRTGLVTDFSVLPIVNPHDNGVPVRVPVSLLVHEATDACLPPSVDPQHRTGKNRTPESVTEKAVLRGHSTPAMAGAFARSIAAERLVLNHIGARFPAPDMEQNAYHRGHGGGRQQFRVACMREIERQAAAAWNPRRNMQRYVQAAWDFLTVSIPPNAPRAAMDVDVSVGMVDVAAAAGPSGAGSSKGKARNYSTMAADEIETEMPDASEFKRSAEMSGLEDEDQDGMVSFTAATGSRGHRDRNAPGGSGPQLPVDGDNSDRKRRAPAGDGLGRSWDGFGSERGRVDGRGRGGDHRRGFGTASESGRGVQGRHHDRDRKPRSRDRARSGRGGVS